jgi:hypothetical protein
MDCKDRDFIKRGKMNTQEIISILMESPLYMEVPLAERVNLVKYLAAGSGGTKKSQTFLERSSADRQLTIRLFDDDLV